MFRLPYRAMCSREVKHLIAGKVQLKLGARIPNIDNGAAAIGPSVPNYFVYYGEFREFGIPESVSMCDTHYFSLVEVNGFQERVLEQGIVLSSMAIKYDENGYASFIGSGKKLGTYKYYCSIRSLYGVEQHLQIA